VGEKSVLKGPKPGLEQSSLRDCAQDLVKANVFGKEPISGHRTRKKKKKKVKLCPGHGKDHAPQNIGADGEVPMEVGRLCLRGGR